MNVLIVVLGLAAMVATAMPGHAAQDSDWLRDTASSGPNTPFYPVPLGDIADC